jgi:CRISPR-associated protein (TIGR03984 family)
MENVKKVSTTGAAWLLVSGHQSSGFGWVTAEKVELGVTPAMTAFSAEHLWDIRLFDDLGEWHCWKAGGKWTAKLRLAQDWTARRERQFALWGTGVTEEGEWWRISEQRGTTLRVPKAALAHLDASNLPLQLEAWERVGCEPETGLAGIEDAMLRKITTKEG